MPNQENQGNYNIYWSGNNIRLFYLGGQMKIYTAKNMLAVYIFICKSRQNPYKLVNTPFFLLSCISLLAELMQSFRSCKVIGLEGVI